MAPEESKPEPDGAPAAEEAAPAASDAKPDQPQAQVQMYDFRRPSRLSMDQMRTLQRMHEGTAEKCASGLTGILGTSVAVSLTSIQEMTYEVMTESMPEIVYVNILDLDPLPQKGLVALDVPFCLSCVDHLLGGHGEAQQTSRTLTEIDHAVLDHVVAVLLDALRETWQELVKAKYTIVERHMEIRLLQLLPPSETLLMIQFDLGGLVVPGALRFGLPLANLESVMPSLSQRWTASGRRRNLTDDDKEHLRAAMKRVMLPISAIIGSTEIRLRDMVQLAPGDVLRLDQKVTGPMVLMVEGVPKFAGRAGLVGRNKALRIEAPLSDMS